MFEDISTNALNMRISDPRETLALASGLFFPVGCVFGTGKVRLRKRKQRKSVIGETRLREETDSTRSRPEESTEELAPAWQYRQYRQYWQYRCIFARS